MAKVKTLILALSLILCAALLAGCSEYKVSCDAPFVKCSNPTVDAISSDYSYYIKPLNVTLEAPSAVAQ